MKILLSDQVIETPVGIEEGVQVVQYDGQTFSELCGIIVGLATEQFDLAIVVNDRLANVIPFFDETIVVEFKGFAGLKTISFYGDKFTFTNKYIEFFELLQQELEIDVYYAGRKGNLYGGIISVERAEPDDAVPVFFATPFFADPVAVSKPNLFNECNQGCWADKAYFTYAVNVSHKLHGDLTIDYTGNYGAPIEINGTTFDGGGHTITLESDGPINNSANFFRGLFNFKNGSIINLKIKVNTKYVILIGGAGWLCANPSANPTRANCLIDNCHVCAVLDGLTQGGLVDSDSFCNLLEGSKITIQNCSFTGNMSGSTCGGIVGPNSFRSIVNSTIIIKDCYFNGDIYGSSNGGIVGEGSFRGPTTLPITGTAITIQNCGASGNINGSSSAGIIGRNSFNTNRVNTTITIQKCSFTGKINGSFCGGIAGEFCFGSALTNKNTQTTIMIRECNVCGNIVGNSNGGLIGRGSCKFLGGQSTITIYECHFAGDIFGSTNGGIIGRESCTEVDQNCAITIYGCSFSGDVLGGANAGIIGFSCLIAISGDIIIQNCCVSGDINGGNWGGIVGDNSIEPKNSGLITIQNCYSFCNFLINCTQCGGIVGTSCGTIVKTSLIKNCYSTGIIFAQNSGPDASYAILGNAAIYFTVSDCIYNSSYDVIAGFDYSDGPQNTYLGTIGLPNITGRTICNNPDTIQIIYTPYGCPLHPKLLNTCPYQKQNKNLTIVAAFSICKPVTICSILTFILKNACGSDKLYLYSKDMKFKSQLYWNNNNAQYNGTLASGTYIIAAKKHC